MNQFRKKLKRFLENPESTPYAVIETILLRLDFTLMSTQESHKKFSHPNLKYRLVFPIHKIAADALKKLFHV